jgi:hypothetical protein
LTTLNRALMPPMARASVSTAASAKTGERRSSRPANWKSFTAESSSAAPGIASRISSLSRSTPPISLSERRSASSPEIPSRARSSVRCAT